MRVVAVAMGDAADVVQKDQVDLGAPPPLLAAIKAAHDAVGGIVEHRDKVQPFGPARIERVFPVLPLRCSPVAVSPYGARPWY